MFLQCPTVSKSVLVSIPSLSSLQFHYTISVTSSKNGRLRILSIKWTGNLTYKVVIDYLLFFSNHWISGVTSKELSKLQSCAMFSFFRDNFKKKDFQTNKEKQTMRPKESCYSLSQNLMRFFVFLKEDELVSFCQLDNNSSHMRRQSFSCGIVSIKLAWGHVCGTCTRVSIDMEWANPLWAMQPLCDDLRLDKTAS